MYASYLIDAYSICFNQPFRISMAFIYNLIKLQSYLYGFLNFDKYNFSMFILKIILCLFSQEVKKKMEG